MCLCLPAAKLTCALDAQSVAKYVARYSSYSQAAAKAATAAAAVAVSPAQARDEATSREAAAWRLRALHQYIVTRGEDLYLKMLMVDHLMHTDLHPGNIIVEPNAPALVLVDAGARLSVQPR